MDFRQKITKANKKYLFLAILILAIVLVSFNYIAKKDKTTSNQTRQMATPAVEVMIVTPQQMVKNIKLVGQAVSDAQIDIVAKYQGHVAKVNVELGQIVNAGDILIVQDIGDINLELAAAQAINEQARADLRETSIMYDSGFSKAQVDYENSLATYNRYKSLYQIGAVSREVFDNTEKQMLNYKATLDSYTRQNQEGEEPASVQYKVAGLNKAEKNVLALAKKRDDMFIKAPRTGIIGFRQVEEGAFVQPGQKLLTLVDNNKFYIDCMVAEQDIGAVGLNQLAKISIDALGRTYDAKTIYISPSSDAKTQNYMVRLELLKGDEFIKSGMFARAQIEVVQRKETLFIPKEAIGDKNGTPIVYVLNETNQVEIRTITTGLKNNDYTEILTGLQSGDRIAVTNLSRLKPGMTVVVNDQSTGR